MITDRKLYTVDRAMLLNSVLTAIAMVAYFFIMKLMGLNYVLEAHYFNILIIFAGMYLSIRQGAKNNAPYFVMMFTGLKIAFMSSALFSFFIIIYLSFIDPLFMVHLKEFIPLGHIMTPWRIAVVLFIEQSSAGIIGALLMAMGESSRREKRLSH